MNSSMNVTFTLEEEDFEEFRKNRIPITAYLILLCIVGTIGNSHVLLVYLLKYTSSIYKTLILCIAAVDFLGCTFCIPGALFIIRHPKTIQSLAFCKVNMAFSYFVGAYSLLSLDCIAVERYRKVCQATRVQFTIRTIRMVCAINCVFALVVFVTPVAIIYGINRKTTKIHSLLGYECTVSDHFKNSTLVQIYMGFVFIIFVLLFIISVVLYTLIGRTIYAHLNKRRKTCALSRTKCCMPESKHTGNESTSSEDGCNPNRHSKKKDISSDITDSATSAPGHSDSNVYTESYVMTTDPRDPGVNSGNSRTEHGDKIRQSTGTVNKYPSALNKRKKKNLDKSRTITMVFLVVSILSFGAYLPYLVVTLMRNITGSIYENVADSYGALDVFIRWMVYLNNAINPLVYGFMDKKFRNKLSNCYVEMTRWCCVFLCRRGH